MSIRPLQPGTLLYETRTERSFRFRVERELGHGGFGITYLATDFEFGGPCVIKELALTALCARSGATGSISAVPGREVEYQRWLDRFEREAHAIHRIQHANVIRVRASWRERGTAYYAMDLVPHARELPSPDQKVWEPMPWARAEQIALGVLSALHAVHCAGLVHGDIKPSNVLLDVDDRPVLIDFGTVRTQADVVRTLTGAIFTPGYAPPELSARSDLPLAGPWSDLYSWAMVVWGLVARHRGPEGRPLDAATRQSVALSGGADRYAMPATALQQAGVPEPWITILVACLCLDVAKRPQRVTSIWAELQSSRVPPPTPEPELDDVPNQPPPPTPLPQPPRLVGARKPTGWRWLAAAAGVVGAAALVGLALPDDVVDANATTASLTSNSQSGGSKSSASASSAHEPNTVVASRELLIGTWNVDFQRSIFAADMSDEERVLATALMGGMQLRMMFERTGSMVLTSRVLGETQTERGTYRVVRRDGNMLEIETTTSDDNGTTTDTALVRFIEQDTATIQPDGEDAMYMNRVR